MAPYPGSYPRGDSDDEDGRNSPTSSPCELTYNNLFERFACLSTVQTKELAEAQKIPKSTTTPIVTRQWSEDLGGELITPDNSLEGKQASNGQPPWEEIMLDFYRVQLSPGGSELANIYTISTSGRLARWMKEHGALQFAVNELKWAEMESDPQQTRPWHVWNAVEEQEQKSRSKACGWGESRPKGGQGDHTGVFRSSNYPAPWPPVPFSYSTEKLRHRIEYQRLPRRLVIHDPWKLLTVTHSQDDTNVNVPWTDMPDITVTYRLELSEKEETLFNATARASGEHNSDADGPSDLQGFFLDFPKVSSSPIAPPIYVVHTPPPTSLPIPEAHVYLSPAHLAGRGTHFGAYHAELELPRDALTPFVMCKECVREDIMAKLEKEDGNVRERMDNWKTESTTVEIVGDAKCGNGILTAKSNTESTCLVQDDDCNYVYIVKPVLAPSRVQVTGPIRRIRTSVPWRNISHPAACNHPQPMTSNIQSESKSHPTTTRVGVVAKLSTKGSEWLLGEARNYQAFASRLFERSRGFNLIPPLQNPVPVGAVVPHFYGYYIPESSNEKSESETGRGHIYLSPILLLEDCGTL